MGDFNHPRVTLLREFRDEWILKRTWGANFVERYYEIGPKLAAIIASRSALQRVSYCCLVQPASVIARLLLRR